MHLKKNGSKIHETNQAKLKSDHKSKDSQDHIKRQK